MKEGSATSLKREGFMEEKGLETGIDIFKMNKILGNPLSKIIALSLVLAIGFLLVILGSTLYNNWLPIISAFILLVAHLPIVFCNRWSSDDFMSETSTYFVDFGKFISAFLLISGLGFSLVLQHSHVIRTPAAILSIIGGVLIYGTVVLFTSFFDDTDDDEFAI